MKKLNVASATHCDPRHYADRHWAKRTVAHRTGRLGDGLLRAPIMAAPGMEAAMLLGHPIDTQPVGLQVRTRQALKAPAGHSVHEQLEFFRRIVGGILLTALLTFAHGCQPVAGPAGFTPISDPTRRLDVPGMSILPPRGENWFVATAPRPQEEIMGASLIRIDKKLRDALPARPEDARAIYARVAAYDLQHAFFEAPAAFDFGTVTPAAFLRALNAYADARKGKMVTARQRLIGLDVTPDDSLGATCVRYSRVAELSGWVQFRDSVFVLASQGLYCLHPYWPRYMIDVGYTQLYLKGEEPLPVEAEVETFLRGPVFTSTAPLTEAPALDRWTAHMRAGRMAGEWQRWSEAEASFKAAMGEAEKSFGAQDLRLAQALYFLALVHIRQDRRGEAELLYRRALAIYEQQPGADQQLYGQTLSDLGTLYMVQGQYAQAEPLLKRSLAVRENALGPDHRDVGQSLYSLMDLYARWERWADAEPFARRALPIYERAMGRERLWLGRILHLLGLISEKQGRLEDADSLLKRGLVITEQALGPQDPDVAHQLEDYAAILRQRGSQLEAEQLEARAKAIRSKYLPQDQTK